jgi:hypothetical protein
MKKIQRINPAAELKNKIKKLKDDKRLPKDFRDILIERYPEYNTLEGGKLVEAVFLRRAADLRLTSIFEEIADEYFPLPYKQEEGQEANA